MNLSKIVNIQINKQTTPISVKGFGTINIYGDNLTGASRRSVRVAGLSDVAGELTNGSSDPEYKVAAGIFSAPNPPKEIVISKKLSGDADYAAGLDALIVEDNDWYGLTFPELRTTIANGTQVANWVGTTDEKLMFAGTIDSNVIGQAEGIDTTSFPQLIKNAANYRVANCFSKDTTTYLEGAYAGDTLRRTNIGGYTMAHKAVSKTVIADLLTPSEQNNAWNKFCSTYEPAGAGNRLMMSWVGDGDYVDTIVFIDWLKARLQEALIFLLQTVEKIPYTNEGFTQIQNAMDPVFKTGRTNGGLDQNFFDANGVQLSGYKINVPDAFDISSVTKATRHIDQFTFTAWYTGAGHTIDVTGNVTL